MSTLNLNMQDNQIEFINDILNSMYATYLPTIKPKLVDIKLFESNNFNGSVRFKLKRNNNGQLIGRDESHIELLLN